MQLVGESKAHQAKAYLGTNSTLSFKGVKSCLYHKRKQNPEMVFKDKNRLRLKIHRSALPILPLSIPAKSFLPNKSTRNLQAKVGDCS
jgi:hypothetical protein